jgi:serine/threonine-protein kinase
VTANRFGRYELVELLGRGGMAEVWRARIDGPTGFARTLVVKRIRPELAADRHFVEMFLREARLSARLTHPNIVQVFELGEVNGEYFLALEHLEGEDFGALLAACPDPPPLGLGPLVVRDVCRALACAHEAVDDAGAPLQIIHRDVSPGNVMIGQRGEVKLVDFGIAKALAAAGDGLTNTQHAIKGKYGYMSPEQMEGSGVDHRTDLYACGVLLYEALTGTKLFGGSTDFDAIRAMQRRRIEPPSSLVPEIPPALDAICLRALQRKASDRFATAAEMASALDEVVRTLGFDHDQLADLMHRCFRGAPPPEPGAATEVMSQVAPKTEPSPGSRRGPILVGAIAAIGLLTVGGALWWKSAHRSETALAPIVVPAPIAIPIARDAGSSEIPVEKPRPAVVEKEEVVNPFHDPPPRPAHKAPPVRPPRQKRLVKHGTHPRTDEGVDDVVSPF